jgi:hypothetical protein
MQQSKCAEQCLLLLGTSACCCFALAEHNFKIPNYSHFNGKKPNECVVSEKFWAAGHEWVSKATKASAAQGQEQDKSSSPIAAASISASAIYSSSCIDAR